MKRRDFLKHSTVAAVATGALSACGQSSDVAVATDRNATPIKKYKWKMVTAWPRNFPGLGTGANYLAEIIGKMSAGQLEIKVYGGNELVPPFETFDAVSRGTAEMGHAGAYYWKGKVPEAQFFGAVPFGMNAQEMNGWLYHGGALELWTELYAKFNLIPFAAGSTGVQMGGWFSKEINSIADLQGLKMRIPGLGGEVFRRAGGTPVSLPGGELFTSLQTGVIDATEWVGPYNDLALGFYKAAKYYYYPGWHEPNATLECMVNKTAFDALPAHLQEVIRVASQAANLNMLSEYTARSPAALQTLLNDHGVKLRKFPDDVLATLKQKSAEIVTELAGINDMSRRIHKSYMAYLTAMRDWSNISERAYLEAR